MRHSLICTILAAILATVMLPSCHSRRPVIEPLHVKLLVVDFDVSRDIAETPRQIKGWWFGSRDIYQNPNAGEIFSDLISERLNREISCVDVYSRTDFRYYLANKKDRLSKAYPDLSEESLDNLFSEVPAVDFARDLQMDLVLIGKLNRCYTGHSRTFHTWSSLVDADAILLDTETGEPEWSGHFKSRKKFRSQSAAMEKLAKRMIKQIKKEYFYR